MRWRKQKQIISRLLRQLLIGITEKHVWEVHLHNGAEDLSIPKDTEQLQRTYPALTCVFVFDRWFPAFVSRY